jgi:hypothetical protein
LLPEGYIEEIREIAKQDTQTQELYQHIVNLPYISEEEIEEQIINLDKSLIEHGQGFIEWEKQQIAILDSSKYIDRDKFLSRIDVLREWATENGFTDPIMERNKKK